VLTTLTRSTFTSLIILILIICISGCNKSSPTTNNRDAFINNPFAFTIVKNYSDDFTSIGTIINSASKCPLEKENIADPAFCFLRTVTYDGLTVNIFSFDVLQGGTAEYLVTNDHVRLTNGLTIGSTKKELTKKMGKPYKIIDDKYIWRSTDLKNYLVFTVENGLVATIRWHEERQPEYKGIIVWETNYE
jgi:hypothetical protein